MVGAEVTELIQGFVVAMNLETTEEDLIHTIFPHPDAFRDDEGERARRLRHGSQYLVLNARDHRERPDGEADMIGLILWIAVGGAAGYIAERLMGGSHSLLVNVGLGIAGSFAANVVLWIMGYRGDGNLLGQLIMGIIGASALLWG